MVARLSRREFIGVGAGAAVIGTGDCRRSMASDAGTAPGGPAMKTIGVLGGIGPQATMDFEARVHRVAQRLIPQRLNGG